MLKHLGIWTSNSLLFPHPTTFSCSPSLHTSSAYISPSSGPLKSRVRQVFGTPCRARRRVLYEEEGEEEEYGYNEEIAILEIYTQSMKDEILLVQAMVDEELIEVLIFKGFSSCLSSKTCSDPSRSVLPAKAVIKSIDRAKGPFDPSDIQYIEKGLTFDAFKSRFHHQN
ncbi:hypothetical protein Pfo_009846 [Paulownia fortunei]|nr:hypothetical protein Pfo_009846 [Paulownia fortunei]